MPSSARSTESTSASLATFSDMPLMGAGRIISTMRGAVLMGALRVRGIGVRRSRRNGTSTCFCLPVRQSAAILGACAHLVHEKGSMDSMESGRFSRQLANWFTEGFASTHHIRSLRILLDPMQSPHYNDEKNGHLFFDFPTCVHYAVASTAAAAASVSPGVVSDCFSADGGATEVVTVSLRRCAAATTSSTPARPARHPARRSTNNAHS